MSRLLKHLHRRTWHTVLPGRGVLAVEGKDARKLLQGLVTSDLAALEAKPQHTAFLAQNGRVLFDAFLVPWLENSVLIEAEAAAIPALMAHLRRYKLRSKVTMHNHSKELAVLAICGQDAEAAAAASQRGNGSMCWADPRLEALGYRQLLPRGALATAASALPPEAPAELYALMTTVLGVAEGGRDMPAGEALPHESGLDLLGSICFSKGCYLGQELTARTEFRGTVRKRCRGGERASADWPTRPDRAGMWRVTAPCIQNEAERPSRWGPKEACCHCPESPTCNAQGAARRVRRSGRSKRSRR